MHEQLTFVSANQGREGVRVSSPCRCEHGIGVNRRGCRLERLHPAPAFTMRVTLDEHTDGHTRMVIETTFPSTDAMERLVATGMEEGMSLALGQIDDLLRTWVHQ